MEAQALVWTYVSDDPYEGFLGYRVADDRRYEFGGLKSDLPLHLRILFDSTEDVPMLGARTGVLIYQRTRSGKHVVVRAPGRRRPLLSGVFGS